MSESPYIGKFVCYDQADGGFCWGRIKDEAVVNSMQGEKEVFILTDRYVRYNRVKDLRNFRQFFPNATPSSAGASTPGSMKGGDETFLETRRVKGDSTLRKEMIDLEKDIVDLDDVLGAVSDHVLFKAVLAAKDGAEIDGTTALEIGLNALLREEGLSVGAKNVLRRRLGIDV